MLTKLEIQNDKAHVIRSSMHYGYLFTFRLQYGEASLCYQLLPEFSSSQFETQHRCYKHIEVVHVKILQVKP